MSKRLPLLPLLPAVASLTIAAPAGAATQTAVSENWAGNSACGGGNPGYGYGANPGSAACGYSF